MKLIRKFVIVALFLFGLAICAADQNTNKQVVYETPTIEKRSSVRILLILAFTR